MVIEPYSREYLDPIIGMCEGISFTITRRI
jgi:hypothetical protein